MTFDLNYPSGTGGRPSARHPAAADVIDHEVLRQLIEDVGEDAAPEIIEAFRDELELQVDGIRTAYSAGDTLGLARMAHRMKSGAASVGALALSHRAAALERAARAGDASALDREMAGFDALAMASGTGLSAAWEELCPGISA